MGPVGCGWLLLFEVAAGEGVDVLADSLGRGNQLNHMHGANLWA